MVAHNAPLLGGQGAGLVEDRLRNPDLPDVVKGREDEYLALGVQVAAGLAGEKGRIAGDPVVVLPGLRIARVDDAVENVHDGSVEGLELAKQALVRERERAELESPAYREFEVE